MSRLASSMMEPFTLTTSHFIMNGTVATRALLESSDVPPEQELYPLKVCNREANRDDTGKENGTCLAIIGEAADTITSEPGIRIQSVTQEEEELTGLIWNENDSSATYVGQSAWHIPSSLTFHYASRIRRLDLSFNCLQTLAGIEFFNALEELVLDNNLLDDSIRFFYNPMMRILSINKNKITDLERFLNEVTLKLPSLTYLSLLGNAACPDQLSSSDHDEQDYRRYRSYVIHRVPLLRFLDSTAIRVQEREEAKQRGHYYKLIRLNSDSFIEKQRSSSRHEEEFRQQSSSTSSGSGNNRSKLTPLPFDANNTPKGGYGRLRHRYTGKHSEGNRFIRNHEL